MATPQVGRESTNAPTKMPKRYTEPKPDAVFDTECLPNYWSIAFKVVGKEKRKRFELFRDGEIDRHGIVKILRNYRVIGFNSLAYDTPMLMAALSGFSTDELKRLNDALIIEKLPYWEAYERFGIERPSAFYDHIDLMNVSPGSPQNNPRVKGGVSLKMYAGRLHSRHIKEMHVDWDEDISPEMLPELREYHGYDLDDTEDLFLDLKTQIELRCVMSDEYGVDLRSKSDAQIAEAVIKAEIQRITGTKIPKPVVKAGKFKYVPPKFIKYDTPVLKRLFEVVTTSNFTIGYDGNVYEPEGFKDLKIELGQSRYTFGIGGLHSTESRVAHVPDGTFTLRDRDVTSYYPLTILNTGLVPPQFGVHFAEVFRTILNRRVSAKKAGDKNTAETLKIVLNGTFGKLGSSFSILYAPNLMIQTTITGQLSILMLIERLELAGITVVSANTDGVVSKVPNHLSDKFYAICFDWECDTGYTTEEVRYEALYSRDVNNYLAIYKDKDKLKVKRRGAYGERGRGLPGAAGQKHNPDAEICSIAVIEYLTRATPIEETIENCDDIRKFVTVRRVQGGAEKNGEFIGKVVRWYQSTEDRSPLVYAMNGNKVPSSDGAKPLMLLPDDVPDDIDYKWYIDEAYAILREIGAESIDRDLVGRKGVMYARAPDQKTVHRVKLPNGVGMCGKTLGNIRDKWVEYPGGAPMGMRLCSKCAKAMDEDDL